jgi:hypothetical protein
MPGSRRPAPLEAFTRIGEGFTRPVGEVGGRTSRFVSRILWLGRFGALRPATIHLGLSLPAGSCGLPAGIGRAALERLRRNRKARFPYGLAPGGVYLATQVTLSAGGLLHHRFTLTSSAGAEEAVCFLWHCPAGHPGSALPTTLPCGARTFLATQCAHTMCSAAARPTRSPP